VPSEPPFPAQTPNATPRHFPLHPLAGVGGSTEAIYSYFFSPPGFVMETLTQPPDGGRGRPGTEGFWDPAGERRALWTPRETAGRDHVPGRGGGRRRSAPARPRPPPLRRRPPLAGGCELHLVKPSPGIYRSLERNEVAFGEEGGGRPTATAASARQRPRHHHHRSHPSRPARGEAAAAAGARAARRGEEDQLERAAGGSTHPGTSRPTPAPSTPQPRAGGSEDRREAKPDPLPRALPSSALHLPGSGPRAGVPAPAPGARLPDTPVPAARTKP
jgi:hypothetical protein